MLKHLLVGKIAPGPRPKNPHLWATFRLWLAQVFIGFMLLLLFCRENTFIYIERHCISVKDSFISEFFLKLFIYD